MNSGFANKTLNKVTLNERKEFYVTSYKVYCEGTDANSKHPKVFLQIPSSEEIKVKSITCPYCAQKFIFKQDGK